jgi:hypothetical protein
MSKVEGYILALLEFATVNKFAANFELMVI